MVLYLIFVATAKYSFNFCYHVMDECFSGQNPRLQGKRFYHPPPQSSMLTMPVCTHGLDISHRSDSPGDIRLYAIWDKVIWVHDSDIYYWNL